MKIEEIRTDIEAYEANGELSAGLQEMVGKAPDKQEEIIDALKEVCEADLKTKELNQPR